MRDCGLVRTLVFLNTWMDSSASGLFGGKGGLSMLRHLVGSFGHVFLNTWTLWWVDYLAGSMLADQKVHVLI